MKFFRRCITIIVAGLLIAVAGCAKVQPLQKGEMDQLWYLDQDVWPSAQPAQVTVEDTQVPTRWTFYLEPDEAKAASSQDKAANILRNGGADEIRIGISPSDARQSVAVMRRVRQIILDLKAISRVESPRDIQRWAATTAKVLAATEEVVRAVEANVRRRRGLQPPSAGTPATQRQTVLPPGPMTTALVKLLSQYHREGSLADLSEREFGQLRAVLTQMILRVSFAAAGKEDPPELVIQLARQMQSAPQTTDLVQSLVPPLSEGFVKATSASPTSPLPRAIQTFFTWSPRVMEISEHLLSQWENVQYVSLEYRKSQQGPLGAIIVAVVPGRQITATRESILQPAVIFTGTTRISAQPFKDKWGDTSILFEPESPGAGVNLKFHGPLWALVRLLAAPISDGELKEIRLASSDPLRGCGMTRVVLMMRAADKKASDPRRMLVYFSQSEKQVRRMISQVRLETTWTKRSFIYFTSSRSYYFRYDSPGPMH